MVVDSNFPIYFYKKNWFLGIRIGISRESTSLPRIFAGLADVGREEKVKKRFWGLFLRGLSM
jgi:hypothetical protein